MSENPRETDVLEPESDPTGATEEGEAISEVFQVGEIRFTEEDLATWKKSADDVKSFKADYAKKTTAAAEKSKQAEALVSQYNSALSDFDNKIKELEQVILTEDENINWDELAETDPSEFLKQQKRLENKRRKLEEAKVAAKQSMDQALNASVADEHAKLRQLVPDWYGDDGSTTAEQKADLEIIMPYLESKGFTNADINGPLVARNWAVYRDAAKFHALQGRKAEVTKLAPKDKTVKGGESKISNPKDIIGLFYN